MTSDKTESLQDIIARFMNRPAVEQELRRIEEQAAFARRQREEVLRRVNVPRKCIEALADLERTKAIETVEQAKELLVVLAGGVGVGKSVAAAHWLATKLGDVTPGPHMGRRWYVFGTLPPFGPLFDEACRVRAAVLDDVGTEVHDESDRSRSMMDAIVNERHSNGRSTCITTNLDAARFRERYGERVYDRLRGDGIWYAVAGKSRR